MRSRSLNRRNDRRALMLTLAGAGASLVLMLVVLGEPALRACAPDDRGTLACLRDATFKRLNLPAEQVADLPQPALPGAAAPATSTSDASDLAEAPDPRVPEVRFEVVLPPEPLDTAAIEPEAPRAPYRPGPEKLERTPVAVTPHNVPAPVVVAVPSAPPPAETGSIETPVAPAVEALVEPERLQLPQLPPPPLAPERVEVPANARPSSSESAPPPARLADQPLPSSALPVPEVVAPAALPPVAPADTAAAAATAIADPALPLPADLAAPPAAVEPPAAPVAEVSPIPAEPPPSVAATPPADPTIDTIAFDLSGTIVAGDGPKGAVIKLYLDTELVGEGEVLDGRWEVRSEPLFAVPMQTLRAVAVDPETGRVLGETEISIELEIPESAAPHAPDEPAATAPDRIADLEPATPPPAPVVPQPAFPSPTAAPEPAAPAGPAADLGPPSAIAPSTEPASTLEQGVKPLPPLRIVVPKGETASVTILPTVPRRLVEHPGGEFAVFGD